MKFAAALQQLIRARCIKEDLFRLKFPLAPGETESPPVVTISLMDTSNGRLRWNCTVCESLCEHVGAAFSFILDEKMTLGLAAPPARTRTGREPE